MAARPRPTHLTEPGDAERRHESHEPVAGRVGVDGVGFDDGRPTAPGLLPRCLEETGHEPLPPVLARHEKADEGPDVVLRGHRDVLAPQPAVRGARRDGTPGDGLAFEVAQGPHRNPGPHPAFQRGFPARAIPRRRSTGRGTPDHAPAVLRPAAGFEEPLQIAPAAPIHFMEDELHDCRASVELPFWPPPPEPAALPLRMARRRWL